MNQPEQKFSGQAGKRFLRHRLALFTPLSPPSLRNPLQKFELRTPSFLQLHEARNWSLSWPKGGKEELGLAWLSWLTFNNMDQCKEEPCGGKVLVSQYPEIPTGR